MLEKIRLFEREAIPFPKYNSSEFTLLKGTPINRTTLDYWNYTLYSNSTVSNDTDCVLLFNQYSPDGLDENGTWVNATSCYNPIYPMGKRTGLSIGFAVAFGVMIPVLMWIMKEHIHLRVPGLHKLRIVSRRWQWYWMIITIAFGFASSIVGIDVDRSYLQHMPITLTSVLFCLMIQSSFAMIWEMTRHWGSFQLRQITEADLYAFRDEDRRAKFEFYIPLVFYFFNWMYFFMTIPRSWNHLEKQRSAELIATVSKPLATDGRFKASAFMLLICWLITASSMVHSLKYYRPTNPGPWKVVLVLAVMLVSVGYIAAMAWDWDVSVFNAKADPFLLFFLGYGPSIAVMWIMAFCAAFLEQNEDAVIATQSRARTQEMNRQMGIVPKPSWWRLGEHWDPAMNRARRRNRRLAATSEGDIPIADIPMQDVLSPGARKEAETDSLPPYREQAESVTATSVSPVSAESPGPGVSPSRRANRPYKSMLDI